EEARAAEALARALEARGGTGDGERGAELRSQAADQASRVGLALPIAGRASASPAPVRAAPPRSATLRREGDIWTIACAGEITRLKATKGVVHLAQLLGHPGREFHARDLMGSSEFAAGDAGDVLDAEARRAYRDRLRELGEELAAAQGSEDDERADAL